MQKKPGEAIWRRIATTLREEIAERVYDPGERLPTEAYLASRFEVNRHTVRQAMAALSDEGLIRVEQGRGTFVQEDLIDYELKERTRFSQNLLDNKRMPQRTTLRALDLPAPPDVAAHLEIPRGQPVTLVEIVGHADGRPVSLASHYFSAARFPGLVSVYEETGSVTATLERFGVKDYVRRSTHITARMPNETEARHLKQPQIRPIIQTESVNVDAAGKPVEYGVSRFASDRVQLVVEGGG
jgi:GntR family phosphonate transport system transcriptional regulator